MLRKKDMHNFDTEEFLIDLDKTVYSMNESQSHETSVHEKYKNFIDSFCDVVNKHAPLRKLTRKEKKIREKP